MALSPKAQAALCNILGRSGGKSVADEIDKLEDHSQSELDYLDGLTAGTITASKAAIVDSSKAVDVWLVVSQSASAVSVTVKGASGQSANLTEWTDSSDTVGARITAALEFSNPTTHADASERFGAGAGANMGALARNTAVGRNAMGGMTAGYDNAAFGHEAFKVLTSNSSGNAAFGNKAGLDATNNIGLTLIGGLAGHNILTGQYNTCIGYSAGALLTTGSGNIILGANADTDSNSDSRLFVAGSDTQPIDNVYFGKGITNATPTDYSVHGTGGSGTNIAGADIVFSAGQGTGSGASGNVSVKVAPVGSSGSSANSLAEALRVDATATSGATRLMLYDVDNATLERVTVGAADSGGSGYKVLRIPN